MMALALRFFVGSMFTAMPAFETILIVVIVLSILMGNLFAIRQNNIKRMLAYSSIAHIGYALTALLSIGAGSCLW